MILSVVLHSLVIARLHSLITIWVLSVEAEGVTLLANLFGDGGRASMRLTTHNESRVTIATNCTMLVLNVISGFLFTQIRADGAITFLGFR